MARVFVGMSGGVDSSAAALLLQRQGQAVEGIHLQLLGGLPLPPGSAAPAAADARAVAEKLGVPIHFLDLSREFRESVAADFVAEYQAGRTPNPCIVCNRRIKFGAMLDAALSLGGDSLATGHYARIRYDAASGRWLLLRGTDPARDQSYFLYRLTQFQLAHTLFPLGEMEKPAIRDLAEQAGLVTARKRDSQDICFVPDGDYAAFIARCVGEPSPEGDFLDAEGRVLGRHKGFLRYTRGQHKGLGLVTEQPLYVQRKDPDTRAIYLGPDAALYSREATVRDCSWIAVEALTEPRRVTAKIRHSRQDCPATVEPLEGGRVRILFDEAQRACAPGQSAVFYEGDAVLGGGFLE